MYYIIFQTLSVSQTTQSCDPHSLRTEQDLYPNQFNNEISCSNVLIGLWKRFLNKFIDLFSHLITNDGVVELVQIDLILGEESIFISGDVASDLLIKGKIELTFDQFGQCFKFWKLLHGAGIHHTRWTLELRHRPSLLQNIDLCLSQREILECPKILRSIPHI